MAKLPIACLLSVLVMFASAAPVLAQHTVSGIVVDVGGLPVDNASVEAVPATADPNTPAPRWMRADSQGRFTLQLAPGHYRIIAKREAEGYPDPTLPFNADKTAVFPDIAVENSDISDVRVRFGVKGGFLYGTVRTQRDRSPVPHGIVTIRDARNKTAYVQYRADTEGRFQVAIPSKPIVVSAMAPGHTGASFGNGMEVTVLPGEHVSLVIELDQQ